MFRKNAGLYSINNAAFSDIYRWIAKRTFSDDLPLLDVSMAVPNYAPAESLRKYLSQEINHVETGQYSETGGLPKLRSAMAERSSRTYGARIAPSEISFSAGCTEAFAAVTMGLTNPGDEIILPTPYYFGHEHWLRLLSVHPIFVPADANGAMEPDVRHISDRITSKTRALVLVTPGNPTGHVYSSDFLDQCFELCRRNHIALIIDETYSDFIDYGENGPHHLFQKPAWQDVLIQLYSFSKAFSLTGYRIGCITAGISFQNEVMKILEATSICPSRIGQLAALYSITNLDSWLLSKKRTARERNCLMEELFAKPVNGFRLLSSGAYFAYVEHPFENYTAVEAAKYLVSAHNILAVPGSFFGAGQERFIRIAFANLDSNGISELAQRLNSVERGGISAKQIDTVSADIIPAHIIASESIEGNPLGRKELALQR